MPSLAVYLVAQYARYEMRRMEAELEQKKKAEEEVKAKELELKASEEKELKESSPELLEVKVRLKKLEMALKEIVVESTKQSGSSMAKNSEDTIEKKQSAKAEERETRNVSEAADDKQISENITPGSDHGNASGLAAQVSNDLKHNQEERQSGRPSKDAEK